MLKIIIMKKLLIVFLIMPIMGYSQIDWDKVKVQSTELSTDLHRLHIGYKGGGVSMLAFFSEKDVLLVDAAYEKSGDLVLNKLKELGNANIRYIINTHYHGDHTGGNKILGKNVDIVSHHYVKDLVSKDRGEGERKQEAYPDFARPNITFSDSLAITYDGQVISLIHLPGGHTAGDVLVHFSDLKVLSMGDLLFADKFPYVDINHGGNALRYLEHLKWISENFPSETKIIGGHGPVYTIDQLKDYHKTLKETIQVINEAKEDGQTVEEMQQNRILKKWKQFGTGFISEDFWINTVYNSL
jgi:glyoxylase-like metal-dependent hydrolase (beta-lactamase superfamily II)